MHYKHEKKLRELERLSYVGKVAGSLVHDLKSHFALIKMNFSLLKPKSEPEKNIYSIIERDLESVTKYFKNILMYLRDNELDMTSVDVRKMIDNSSQFMQPFIAKKKIQVINNVMPVIIKADYQKMLSLFKYLIDNSIDAVEDEGKIEVCAEIQNNMLKIYFKDNGTGVASRDRVFEPFFTTKTYGSGFGLAIAKKIIEKHNGNIKLLKSTKGETIFEIDYPL